MLVCCGWICVHTNGFSDVYDMIGAFVTHQADTVALSCKAASNQVGGVVSGMSQLSTGLSQSDRELMAIRTDAMAHDRVYR